MKTYNPKRGENSTYQPEREKTPIRKVMEIIDSLATNYELENNSLLWKDVLSRLPMRDYNRLHSTNKNNFVLNKLERGAMGPKIGNAVVTDYTTIANGTRVGTLLATGDIVVGGAYPPIKGKS